MSAVLLASFLLPLVSAGPLVHVPFVYGNPVVYQSPNCTTENQTVQVDQCLPKSESVCEDIVVPTETIEYEELCTNVTTPVCVHVDPLVRVEEVTQEVAEGEEAATEAAPTAEVYTAEADFTEAASTDAPSTGVATAEEAAAEDAAAEDAAAEDAAATDIPVEDDTTTETPVIQVVEEDSAVERARRAADPQLLLPAADPQLLLGTAADPQLLLGAGDPLLGGGVDLYRRCEDRVEQHCFKNPVIKPSTETIKSCKETITVECKKVDQIVPKITCL